MSFMENNELEQKRLTLRVTGLGHRLTFDITSSATINDVKAEIDRQISLPAPYQQLIARGKNLDQNGDVSLESLEIKNRTSMVLLHNQAYARDQVGVTAITELQREIDELAAKAQDTPPNVVHEIVTQICCKLDAIDVSGSEQLRYLRKQAIAKVEGIDHLVLQNSGNE